MVVHGGSIRYSAWMRKKIISVTFAAHVGHCLVIRMPLISSSSPIAHMWRWSLVYIELKHGKIISMMIQDPPEPRSWFVRVLSSSPPSESDYQLPCPSWSEVFFRNRWVKNPPAGWSSDRLVQGLGLVWHNLQGKVCNAQWGRVGTVGILNVKWKFNNWGGWF